MCLACVCVCVCVEGGAGVLYALSVLRACLTWARMCLALVGI